MESFRRFEVKAMVAPRRDLQLSQAYLSAGCPRAALMPTEKIKHTTYSTCIMYCQAEATLNLYSVVDSWYDAIGR